MRATGLFIIVLASVGVLIPSVPCAVNGYPVDFVHGPGRTFSTGAYGSGPTPRPLPYGHYLPGPAGPTGATGTSDSGSLTSYKFAGYTVKPVYMFAHRVMASE